VLVNNLYGEYSPMRDTTPIDDLADRSASYAMPGRIVDGQDVDAVHEAAVEAVERARAGEGPTLLEMKSYRYRGHSRSDPGRYRPTGELEAWRRRDPIDVFGGRLLAEGAATADDLAAIRSRVAAEIDAATSAAEGSPFPTLADAAGLVYA
jgi:acetoin:2,6-dichlorophenolindophenol oxidoreductase subunit alpha